MSAPKPPDPPIPPGVNQSAPAEVPGRRRRKLSAIMMADVSGFSRMMGQNEDNTVDLIRDFHQRVNLLVQEFEGRVVDTAGDSVFGEFDSVVNAVRCACRIQEEQRALNAGRSLDERVETRIGVHLGDVIVENYHVYGDGVNIAARLEPIADPGGICISEAVYQQIHNKLDLPWQDLGLRELKNIELPIRIYKGPPVPRARDVPAEPSRPPAPTVSVLGNTTAAARSATHSGAVPSPWFDDLMHTTPLILMSVGVFLLLSPLIVFPTGGVFPTAGAIVLSIALGRVWARRSGRGKTFLIALGIGIASGGVFTNWSRLTNSLFLLAGAILCAVGMSQGESKRSRR
jgi:class 3 adenylate cyclase